MHMLLRSETQKSYKIASVQLLINGVIANHLLYLLQSGNVVFWKFEISYVL